MILLVLLGTAYISINSSSIVGCWGRPSWGVRRGRGMRPGWRRWPWAQLGLRFPGRMMPLVEWQEGLLLDRFQRRMIGRRSPRSSPSAHAHRAVLFLRLTFNLAHSLGHWEFWRWSKITPTWQQPSLLINRHIYTIYTRKISY